MVYIYLHARVDTWSTYIFGYLLSLLGTARPGLASPWGGIIQASAQIKLLAMAGQTPNPGTGTERNVRPRISTSFCLPPKLELQLFKGPHDCRLNWRDRPPVSQNTRIGRRGKCEIKVFDRNNNETTLSRNHQNPIPRIPVLTGGCEMRGMINAE